MEPSHLNSVQLYVFLCIISLLAYLMLFRFNRSANGCCKTPNQFPPSPMALPLLGHLHLLRPLLHRSLHALANRYGPILLLRLGTLGDTVLVSSPDLAREFLKSHDLAFASRPVLFALQYTGGHDSTFTFLPYGPRWKFFKKILVTQILSTSRLEKMARIRQEEIKLFLLSLLEKSRGGESVDLGEMLPVLTNNIICRMMFGLKSFGGKKSKEAEEYRKSVREQMHLSSKHFIVYLLLGSIIKFDMFGYGKRLKKANERYIEIVDKIIEEHEQKKKKKQLKQERERKQLIEEDGDKEEEEEDLLDILLKISEDEQAECKLTRHNIKTFLLVCFFNSSSMLSFINS